MIICGLGVGRNLFGFLGNSYGEWALVYINIDKIYIIMIKGDDLYHVLWVDEERDERFVNFAKRYGIEMVQCTSWERGRDKLNDDARYWDAVVLDGNCVLMEGEKKSSDFLYQAVTEMKEVMASKGLTVPWYVMSSGSADDFERTLERIELGDRKRQEEYWGRMAYGKSDEERDELLLAICKSASQSVKNRIRRMYGTVFDTLDKYFDERAEDVMMTILTVLHYPEENRNFDSVVYYTQMRRILEYLFRASYKLGLLPDELMAGDKVNLTNSSCYMDGQIVKVANQKRVKLRGRNVSIFPPIIAGIVKKIINVANKQTHTADVTSEEGEVLREYAKLVGSSNMLFGYALQLCDVLTWFGNYANAHPNVLDNRRMHMVMVNRNQNNLRK